MNEVVTIVVNNLLEIVFAVLGASFTALVIPWLKDTCRSIQLVFKDSGSKEFGAAAVTVDGKEVAVYDPRQAGWTHCHAAIILREETVQKHHIQIKMQETCTDKVFTILGFGVL